MKKDTISVALEFSAFALVGMGTGYLVGSLIKLARNRNYDEAKKNLDTAKIFADVADICNDVAKIISK